MSNKITKKSEKILRSIKGEAIAYNNCHKIYICQNPEEVKKAKELGYKILPMENLEETYRRSCPLRFILSWDLQTTYIKQGTDDDLNF